MYIELFLPQKEKAETGKATIPRRLNGSIGQANWPHLEPEVLEKAKLVLNPLRGRKHAQSNELERIPISEDPNQAPQLRVNLLSGSAEVILREPLNRNQDLLATLNKPIIEGEIIIFELTSLSPREPKSPSKPRRSESTPKRFNRYR